MQQQAHADLKELKPDVSVERYLDAEYYHYDPEDIYELSGYNVNARYLAECDKVVTLNSIETEKCSANASHPSQMARASSVGTYHERSRMSNVYGRSRQ